MVVATGSYIVVFSPIIGSCDPKRPAGAVDLPHPMKDRINRWVEILNRQGSRILFSVVYLAIVPLFWLFHNARLIFWRRKIAQRTTEWNKKTDMRKGSWKEFFDSMG